MGITSEEAKKRAKQYLDKDPDYFKKLGRKGYEAQENHPQYLKKLKEENPELLKEISKKGHYKRWSKAK